MVFEKATHGGLFINWANESLQSHGFIIQIFLLELFSYFWIKLKPKQFVPMLNV
jgi:hypothetical protein